MLKKKIELFVLFVESRHFQKKDGKKVPKIFNIYTLSWSMKRKQVHANIFIY